MMPSLCASTTSGRQEQAHGDVLGNLACHIVALHGVDRGVLVRVLLLGLLVVALDERQDLVVGGVGLALERLVVAVGDVLACATAVTAPCAMIWFSTMSWTSSTDTVWPERLQSHSTLCAASAIWSSVRRSSGTTSPLAPLMALTILLMSNVTSEPLRLMIFMPLTPFLLLAQGAWRAPCGLPSSERKRPHRS